MLHPFNALKVWWKNQRGLRFQLKASRKYDGRYGKPQGFHVIHGGWGFQMEDGSFHWVEPWAARVLSWIARATFRVYVFVRGSF